MQIFSKLEQHFTKQRGHEYVSLTVSDFIRMLPYGCVYWRVWALGKEGVFEQIFEIPDFFFFVAAAQEPRKGNPQKTRTVKTTTATTPRASKVEAQQSFVPCCATP